MALAQFLTDLFDSGRVTVTPMPIEPVEEDVTGILKSVEQAHRLNLPGDAPEFSIAAASWAAKVFYQACQFTVCRDTEANVIATALEEKCPAAHSASTDYSADLVFRFLPDLIQLVRHLAPGDPLLERMLCLAREWPLSSVGVPNVGPVEVTALIEHPSLRQIYVDRVIARRDVTRLGVACVDESVRAALGAFPELCPAIAQHFGLQTGVASVGVS